MPQTAVPSSPSYPPSNWRSTRQRSNAVWRVILAKRHVNRWRLAVLKYVWDRGPSTGTEMVRDLRSTADSSINARPSELVRMGLLEEIGEVLDPVHGQHMVTLYDITGRVGHVLPKTIPKFECWVVQLNPGNKQHLAFSDEAHLNATVAFLRSKNPELRVIKVREYTRKRVTRKKTP